MKIKLTFMIGMLSACTLLLQAQSIDEETARAEACRFFNERITKIPSKRDISRQSPRLKLAEKRMLSNNETAYYILKSASNLNGNLNCSKELEHYAS